MEPYSDSIEHLRDEIARLDWLLKRAVLLARPPPPDAGAEEFRGLVVTEHEIDEILGPPDLLGDRWQRAEAKKPELGRIDHELDRRRQEIDARRELSRQNGIYLALPSIAGLFNLSPAEVDILLVALAPELEPRYETLYAYLQNDVTRKHPSINLALNLVCRSESEKFKARDIFAPGAPLLAHRIVELGEESQDRQPSLLRKFLKIDETAVGFLLDLSAKSGTDIAWITPRETTDDLELEPGTRKHLENLAAYLSNAAPAKVPVIRMIGDVESSLRDAAEILCSMLKRQMLFAELSQLSAEKPRLATLMRDVRLWDGILVVLNTEPGIGTEAPSGQPQQAESSLWTQLKSANQLVLLLGPASTFTQIPHDAAVWRVEVRSPDFKSRQQAWQTQLGDRAKDVDSLRLADAFHFGGRRIRQTLNVATGLAVLRDPANTLPTTQDLLDAGRALTTPQMGRFAIRVEPRYGWNDIVLPPDKLSQLRRVESWMKFRRQVHGDWGFGQKLSRGKGLNVLFTGPSGTGKTMAAEILAGELSLELLQIDLSSVVSKYIGETEKNLSAIFREAEQSQALLFFDEADSLFGKRTEVKDAHDRYANIEVNYLLQRVEQYEGVVVLATNMQRNLDEAFLRRMQEVVEFPFPDEALRENIWRRHFPKEAPQADDIDYAFLARQFKLTGGNIKNIVLNAAFLAAQEPQPADTLHYIQMRHLILSTKTELQKEGKLCVKTDFGSYYELIQKEGVR